MRSRPGVSFVKLRGLHPLDGVPCHRAVPLAMSQRFRAHGRAAALLGIAVVSIGITLYLLVTYPRRLAAARPDDQSAIAAEGGD